MKRKDKLALAFWGTYAALLPLIIVALLQDNEMSAGLMIVGIVWWLLCLPGLILIFALLFRDKGL